MEIQAILDDPQVKAALVEAARMGAEMARTDWQTYSISDAATMMHVAPRTISRWVKDGKMRCVSGRITGREIRRYLTEHGRD